MTLNEFVEVGVMTQELAKDIISGFQCIVVTTGHPEGEIRRISLFCHQHKIKVIPTKTLGFFDCVFVDFGDWYTTGEPRGRRQTCFLMGIETRRA